MSEEQRVTNKFLELVVSIIATIGEDNEKINYSFNFNLNDISECTGFL